MGPSCAKLWLMVGHARPEGLVLCGGSSRRFGGDKPLAQVAGRPLIGYVIEALLPVTSGIRLVAGDRSGRFADLGLEVIVDDEPHAGPAAALANALPQARSDFVFVVSCDMPFLVPDYFRMLLSLIGTHDACMPWGGYAKMPLVGIYRKEVGKRARAFHAEGGKRLFDLVAGLAIRAVSKRELAAFPDHLLMNVNTPDDARHAEALMARHESSPCRP